ncbi:hypothetical protein DAPPUDRAFT_315977 [Daphnia pulex]|uniref:non-specific serine/threonine protein kinase n=1 Tax=Daphnia pulex TaxID=6669 RepID=E9GBC5_DAPPU|nr:hypothetical protein DAPPUDRAFT_315977 [Daphnia pulex]|eukprot:EFX82937.1 hypothetical protein DAPPUDRAFT_315977 [Daphnia pulex]
MVNEDRRDVRDDRDRRNKDREGDRERENKDRERERDNKDRERDRDNNKDRDRGNNRDNKDLARDRDRERRERERKRSRSRSRSRDRTARRRRSRSRSPRDRRDRKDVKTEQDAKDQEANEENTEQQAIKKEPLSLEELLAKKKAEEEEKSKPKFLTKEERAAEAMRKRQEEVENLRKQQEEERSKRNAFFQAAKETNREPERDRRRDREREREKETKDHRQKVLGVGFSGTVFEGVWGETKVAVKRILIKNAASNEQEEKALKMLHHRNVIKLFHVEEDQDFKKIALELCDASLEKLFLKENDPNKYSGPMPPEIEVLLQLAKGLEYIHQMGLVHRDIKPQNVLISLDSTTQRVVMKWADFGLSKKVNERGTFTMTEVKGTHDYFAPEILKLLDDDQIATGNEDKKRGTVKSDVFAEGLVFSYFISGGVHPFGTTSHQIQTNLRTNEPANLPETGTEVETGKNCNNIITEMLEKEPSIRITSSDVVNRLNEIILENSQQLFTLIAKENPSVEEIGKLIQEGVDLNVKDPNGLTPLLRLAQSEKKSENLVEIISLLIQHGGINSIDSNGKNALLLWCENLEQHQNKDFLAIINLFVEKGIDFNCKDKNGFNALTLLCENYENENLIDIIRLFIQKGIDVNCKDEYGRNALILVCENYGKENLIDIIRLLIENGIDINCKTNCSINALTILCTWYQNANLIDIIRLFIENGIDINCQTKYGRNALTILCENYKNENLIDITRLLIENEIDINSKQEYGRNALTLLCEKYKNENYIEVITLIKSGFKVTEKTPDYSQEREE